MENFQAIAKPGSSKPARVFSGLAVIGLVATVMFTAGAVSSATKRLKEINKEDSPVEEQILETWGAYIPAVVSGTATVFCIARASRLNRFRSEALLTAFIIEPLIGE